MHPWGVVKPTEDDVSAYHFLSALVPGSLGERNPESAEMKPGPHTPYGMSFDVVTDDIGDAALSVYPVCILIGRHEFPPETVARLGSYLDNGGTLYLTHKQAAQLGTAYEGLRTHGSIRLFTDDNETMAETVRSMFASLCAEHLPVEVTGGTIEYTINRTPTGWLVGLLNNDGIAKGNLTAVRIDRSCTKRISVRLKNHVIRSAYEWCEDRRVDVSNGDSATVEVPAGEVRVLELTMQRVPLSRAKSRQSVGLATIAARKKLCRNRQYRGRCPTANLRIRRVVDGVTDRFTVLAMRPGCLRGVWPVRLSDVPPVLGESSC